MSTVRTPRLHVKATILGYRRSRTTVHPNQVLLRLNDVNSKEDAHFYLGKVVAYYYRAKTDKNGSKLRCVWGKIIGTHGNSGVVKAKFKKNLSGSSFAQTARVFMYPSSI